MKFETAVQFIIEQEGGYTDNPRDPGGETKYGISRRQYPRLDIANLTESDAWGIYRKDYWDKLHCDELPQGLDLAVFDAGVNQGPSAAAQMLQIALKMPVDGIIGPVTIKAAQNTPGILTEFLARRMMRYAFNPLLGEFGLGWFRRLAAVSQALYRP